MRQVTATCCDCHKSEPSTYASNNYRCASCESKVVEAIRRMAADGETTRVIGLRLGMSYTAVGTRMRTNGIAPAGHPAPKAALVNGFGEPPAKLMPSRHALGLVSIWSFAVHDRSVICTPKQVITNDNELFVGA